MLRPSIGEWPPSPGRSSLAATTIAAPATGSPMTRYHGADARFFKWPYHARVMKTFDPTSSNTA